MASSSSSRSRRYDVFPSFSGEDVRKSFLSHLLKELDRRLIKTFIDHGIERSRPIAPELLLAIRESRIAIVVFSKKYASSTWCLNELVEIHKCYKELNQMAIPIFYNVDPSEVRKQTGEYGKAFNKRCEGKTEDEKQRWMEALTDVANLAGEDLHNWPDEAAMIEKISNDVWKKLNTSSDVFGDFVGIEAHFKAMNTMLCLESEEARMVGIVGPSGIGKSTIGRALFSQLSSQFHHRIFETYERTIPDDYSMRLCWQEKFLSDILCQKNIKTDQLGMVEERFKEKKVLIVLDDVDNLELLKTLVGQTEWFGPGSRIIVITQDRRLLKAHKIKLIYEVPFPSEALALKMLCRSAFGQDSPPYGYMGLANEITKLTANLPLGLSVLGSSLKERGIDDWIEMLPRFRNDLDGDIEKTLRVSYDRLDRKEQDLFLYLAFAILSNRQQVTYIREFLGDSVNIGLTMLADKSLIRITPKEEVEMHNLLQKLARKIVRAETIDNPGKRRYLVDVEDIRDVFTDKTGTETVLGIYLDISDIKEPLFIDEKSFEGMLNLQFLKVSDDWMRKSEDRVYLPQGLAYLSRKLRLLQWYEYPCKCFPSNFKAEFLVELIMEESKLEKLWEGTQPLRSLKKMNMRYSRYFKEIPDLSNAINLEDLDLSGCQSLVTLPSSIQSAFKLRMLNMKNCTKLESLPTLRNLKSLEEVNLKGCFRLRNFPQIYLTRTCGNYEIEVEDCLWSKNLHGVDYLDSFMRCIPSKFRPEHLVDLTVRDSMIGNLWKGVQPLRSLKRMNMSRSRYLKEIPDLSNAINLEVLDLSECESLVTLPSSIQNAIKLRELNMENCTKLENLPTLRNLKSMKKVNLKGCFRLRNFPQINLTTTWRNYYEIKVEDCLWNKNLHGVDYLDNLMRCIPSQFHRPEHLQYLTVKGSMLEKLWEGVQSLGCLLSMDLSECGNLKDIPDLSKATNLESLKLNNCKRLVTFPCIGNLYHLKTLEMKECTGLEVLPTNVNLSSLKTLDLRGCKRLRSFPQISWSIIYLYLNDTAIEEVPCCIEYFSNLTELSMRGCKRLKNISPNIFKWRRLERVDFSECVAVTALGDASVVETTEDCIFHFMFNNCINLDGDAHEIILRSYSRPTFLPGGRVPNYFTHRVSRNSLTVTLPQSSLSQELLGFKACIVLEPITYPNDGAAYLKVCWLFRDRWQHIHLKLKLMYNTDHLLLVPLKFRNIAPPSELDYNDVTFEFSMVADDYEPSPFQRIRGCGIRVMEMSPSPASSDGSKRPML